MNIALQTEKTGAFRCIFWRRLAAQDRFETRETR